MGVLDEDLVGRDGWHWGGRVDLEHLWPAHRVDLESLLRCWDRHGCSESCSVYCSESCSVCCCYCWDCLRNAVVVEPVLHMYWTGLGQWYIYILRRRDIVILRRKICREISGNTCLPVTSSIPAESSGGEMSVLLSRNLSANC